MIWSGAPDFVVKLKITTFEILDFQMTPTTTTAARRQFFHLTNPHPIVRRDNISRSGIPHFDILPYQHLWKAESAYSFGKTHMFGT